jgi:hypothetical protein
MVDDVLALVGDARVVLLGEASHGTREFYELRAEITARLVAEHGFRGVAVEADWPAAARVNRYVQGDGRRPGRRGGARRLHALPPVDVAQPGGGRPAERLRDLDLGAGFYGLDLYSLRESMDAVIAYLDERDPRRPRAPGTATPASTTSTTTATDAPSPAAARTRARTPSSPSSPSCVGAPRSSPLSPARRRGTRTSSPSRTRGWPRTPSATTAACSAAGAAAGTCATRTWPTPSTHWWSTSAGPWWSGPTTPTSGTPAGRRWAWRRDELNLGQLARERHGDDVRIVGFTTATGTVTAARDWEEPGRERELRPPLRGSLERLLHERGAPEAVLDLRGGELAGQELLQRFVGVIYRAESERASHYLHTRPAEQYDVLVHVDRTSALPALDRATGREPADSVPSGQ